MAQAYENLIGGEWVAPGDRWFERTNPADTSDVIGIFAAMNEEEVTRAVDAAAEGFQRWKSTQLLNRGAVLLRAAAIIRERSGEMAIDLTREMGKTLSEAQG